MLIPPNFPTCLIAVFIMDCVEKKDDAPFCRGARAEPRFAKSETSWIYCLLRTGPNQKIKPTSPPCKTQTLNAFPTHIEDLDAFHLRRLTEPRQAASVQENWQNMHSAASSKSISVPTSLLVPWPTTVSKSQATLPSSSLPILPDVKRHVAELKAPPDEATTTPLRRSAPPRLKPKPSLPEFVSCKVTAIAWSVLPAMMALPTLIRDPSATCCEGGLVS